MRFRLSLQDSGVLALFALGLVVAGWLIYWGAVVPRNECLAKTCPDPAKSPAMIQGHCLCVEVPK